MTFAKWVFRIAAIYGLLAVPPVFFMEQTYLGAGAAGEARAFFYGFASVALAWQLVYVLIALDPPRYRPLMLLGALGKTGFGVAVCWLWAAGALQTMMLAPAIIDLLMAAVFVAAFIVTGKRASTDGPAAQV